MGLIILQGGSNGSRGGGLSPPHFNQWLLAASRKSDMASVTFLSIGEHFWWKNNAQLQPLGADLCSIFGFEQMICTWPGGACFHCAGGRCGRRSPPPTTSVQDIYIRNHAMAIGSKGYSDFNTEKRDTIRQNIGADIRSVVPQPNYWEDMSLVPRFQRLSSEPRAKRDTRRVDMFMMRCPCPCRIQENKQKKQHFAARSH